MHIDIVPNRNSKPAILLRESYRGGGKVKKRTLANLSKLSMQQIRRFRQVLREEQLVPVNTLFDISSSQHHGYIQGGAHGDKTAGVLQLDRLTAHS